MSVNARVRRKSSSAKRSAFRHCFAAGRNCMCVSLGPFRLEQRKQDHVANRFRSGEEHRQAIDPKTETTRWRHPVLEGKEEFFVEILRLFSRLLEQTPSLD